MHQVGTGKRIPTTQPLPPLTTLGDKSAVQPVAPLAHRAPIGAHLRRGAVLKPLPAVGRNRTNIVPPGTSLKRRIFVVAWCC
jgi:hypothetical protein